MARPPRSASETLHQAVRVFFRRLAQPVLKVTVALSGGVDSTALVHALAKLPGRKFALAAAHVNHHLRGAESDDDASASLDLCRSLGVPVELLDGVLDESRVRARGIEAAARELRYERLRELLDTDSGHFIATAHQADDQAETLLLRLVTGRGPWRLTGIRPVHDGIIRPLLHVTRATIEEYLSEHRLEPRRDSSNESPRFLRNRIRGALLPLLRELNPRVVEHLGETAELEQERDAFFASVVSGWADAFDRGTDSATVPIDRLPADPLLRRLLVRHEIRRIEPDERYLDVPALIRLDEIIATAGKTRPSRTVELQSDGRSLTIRRVATVAPSPDYEYSLVLGRSVADASSGWYVAAGVPSPPPEAAVAHIQEISLPDGSGHSFVVRNRRRGDRFRPLGMDVEKKLSDFFIDRKIPRDIRDTLPLVLIDGRIAWIAGIEVSDEFRLGRNESERLMLVAWREGDDR